MQMTEAVSGVFLGFLCSSPPRRSSSPSLKGVAVDASRDCHALFAALFAALSFLVRWEVCGSCFNVEDMLFRCITARIDSSNEQRISFAT